MAALLCFRGFIAVLVIPFLVQPTRAVIGGRSFSAKQLSEADTHKHLHLPTNSAQNLFRYGGAIPPGVGHSAEAASVLASAHTEGFLVPVSVGASTLHLSIDTGSSDL